MLRAPGPAASGARINKARAERIRELGPARFNILREAGTEPPWSSPLDRKHQQGTSTCAGRMLPLFSSSATLDSGTSWSGFYQALAEAARE
jgi:peptide-methionine (R)-S-oxide reductase